MCKREIAREVYSLDLLRGIMPVWVFLSHAAIWTGALPQLRQIFIAGGVAVDVFIFMSGFLMLWQTKSVQVKNVGKTLELGSSFGPAASSE